MSLPVFDRRAHSRVPLVRPCQAYLPTPRRVVPGRTCNLSSGGALVALEHSARITPGDPLDLAIAYTPPSLIPSNRLLRGTVVRTETFDDGRLLVAVRFQEALAPPAAA